MMLINGKQEQNIPVTDRGLQYGDGLFETIEVKDGQCPHWQRHMQRLARGCEQLGIAMPDTELLLNEALQVCHGEKRAVLKIILTRGSGGRGYRVPEHSEPTRILSNHPWPEYSDSNSCEGIHLHLCHTTLSTQPALAGIKHLNRLEQVMARREWDDPDVAEGLMSDASGLVVEGTMSNVFAARAGQLYTPVISHCGVAGTMRERIIETAAALSIPVTETTLRIDDLYTMEELFVCNSIIGIWPVRELATRSYIAPGTVTRQLQVQMATT